MSDIAGPSEHPAGQRDLKPFSAWNAKELSSWLRDLQDPFAKYADKFEQAGMVGELLMHYTEPESLKELIPMQGDRDRLWLKMVEAKKLEGRQTTKRPRSDSEPSKELDIAPSDHTAAVCHKLQTKHATYLNGRPAANVGLPLSLAHPLLGQLRDMIAGHSPGQRDFQFVQELISILTEFCDDANARRGPVLRLLSRYFQCSLEGVEIPGSAHETDGFLGIVDGPSPLFSMCVDVSNEVCSTSTLQDFQLAAYYLNFCKLNEQRAQVARSCHPAVLLQVTGQFVRFGAIAYLNKPVQEPLTDFLNVLPYDEGGSFERLAKAFGAVRAWLPLQAQQIASIPQGTHDSRHKYLKMGLPYPVAFPDLCPEFQKAMPGRFLEPAPFFPADQRSPSKPLLRACYDHEGKQSPVVIKFTRRYPERIHKVLYSKQLAPALFACVSLAGGWYVVVSAHLRAEDDWVVLSDLYEKDPITFVVARAKVVEALHLVHSAEEGKIVLGDFRALNIVYNLETQAVSFLDLDWAAMTGSAEAVYPDLLNHREIAWPKGVEERKPMLQAHDRELLSRLGQGRGTPYAWDVG